MEGNMPVSGLTFLLGLIFIVNFIQNGTVSHAFYYVRKNKPYKAENTLKYTFWPKLLSSKSMAYYNFTWAYLSLNKKKDKEAEFFFDQSVKKGRLSKKDFQIAYLNLIRLALKKNNFDLASEYFRLLSSSGNEIITDLEEEYNKLKQKIEHYQKT